MPPIPLADNFLAGSIISLVFPIALLLAVAAWYLIAVRRFGGSRPRAERSPEATSPTDAEGS